MIDNTSSRDVTLTGGTPHARVDPPASDAGQLLVFFEGQLVRSFPLNVLVVTIGRIPANVLPLPHPSVSRAHAELRVAPDAIIVTDMGSANGTFVNDVRLAPQQPVQLTHGVGRNENPWWGPDGLHLVYTSKRGNSTQIFTMLADGNNVKQITTRGNNIQPVWSKAVN